MIRQANNIFNINNSVGYILDVDASKVIEAVRSTGVVITPAMRHYAHYLVSNMKNIGTWQLSNAVYGMVGGTAASHKWNWKDLRDLDSAFRLSFLGGGWVHSGSGSKPDGIASYANTFLPQNFNGTYNITLGYNSFTNINTGSNFYFEMGARSGAGNNLNDASMNIKIPASSSFANVSGGTIGGNQFISVNAFTDTRGFYLLTRETSNLLRFTRNSSIILTNTASEVNTAPISRPFYLGAMNEGGFTSFCSPRGCSFSLISSFLSAIQEEKQSQIVTNSQLILNRA